MKTDVRWAGSWVLRRPAFVLVAAICLLGVSIARSSASIIPTLVSVTPFGGAYVWTYSLTNDVTSQVRPGDFFEQADLANMLPGTATATPSTLYGVGADMPAGWLALELPGPVPVLNPSGTNPLFVTPGFNPLAPAVEVLWTGPGSAPLLGAPGAQGNLGDFAFLSLSPGTNTQIGGYGASDHTTNPILLGIPPTFGLQGNVGRQLVPGPVPVSGAHTAIIGLFGSTLFWFRMRKRSA